MADHDSLLQLQRERRAIVDDAHEVNESLVRFEERFLLNMTSGAKFQAGGSLMESSINCLEDMNVKRIQLLQQTVDQGERSVEAFNQEEELQALEREKEETVVVLDPEQFNKNLVQAVNNSSQRLRMIFGKIHSEYDSLESCVQRLIAPPSASVSQRGDENKVVDNPLLVIAQLKKELDVAELKISSAEIQWQFDLKRLQTVISSKEAENSDLVNKLLLAEGKKRFAHQVDRDDNFIVNVIGVAEYQAAVKAREAAEQDLNCLQQSRMADLRSIDDLRAQISEVQQQRDGLRFENQTSKQETVELRARLDQELEAHTRDMSRHEANLVEVETNLRAIRQELAAEKAANQREREKEVSSSIKTSLSDLEISQLQEELLRYVNHMSWA